MGRERLRVRPGRDGPAGRRSCAGAEKAGWRRGGFRVRQWANARGAGRARRPRMSRKIRRRAGQGRYAVWRARSVRQLRRKTPTVLQTKQGDTPPPRSQVSDRTPSPASPRPRLLPHGAAHRRRVPPRPSRRSTGSVPEARISTRPRPLSASSSAGNRAPIASLLFQSASGFMRTLISFCGNSFTPSSSWASVLPLRFSAASTWSAEHDAIARRVAIQRTKCGRSLHRRACQLVLVAASSST